MILNKKIDSLIFGYNYISLFLGLSFLKKGQSVLLLNDSRTNFGQFYLSTINHFERLLLSRIADQCDIDLLKNHHPYYQISPSIYHLGEVTIRLGDSPFRNLTELFRRFYFAFSSSNCSFDQFCTTHQIDALSFDSQFEAFSTKMIDSIIAKNGSQQVDVSFFMRQAPPAIANLYSALAQWFHSIDHNDRQFSQFRCLLNSLRTHYLQNLSLHYNSLELFYLFLIMLSPCYKIRTAALTEDLLAIFDKAGGIIRHVDHEEWLFEQGKPWTINLRSFEGVVLPKEYSFVSEILPDFPLEVVHQHRFFRSLVFDWKLATEASPFVPQTESFISLPERLGTDYPLIHFAPTEQGVRLRIFYQDFDVSKKQFVAESLRLEVLNALSSTFYFDQQWILSETVEEGDDLILNVASANESLNLTVNRRPVLLDSTHLNNKQMVKDVGYHGVFNHFSLGKISLLKDLFCHNGLPG